MVRGAPAAFSHNPHTKADIADAGIGDKTSAAEHVCLLGYRVGAQMSIFSAISIASSTSMPSSEGCIQFLECASKS
jgi:hypothetical protein